MQTAEEKAEYQRQWYAANRDHHIERARINRDNGRAERRRLLDSAKSVPCADCGVQYPPYVMDFDHLGDKVADLSKTRDWSLARIQQEIDKCDVVCSNCHRERTHQRFMARR